MRIVTWNVNSARARLPRLLAFLDRHQPDLVCLQEIKCLDQAFPHEEFAQAGYLATTHGQKTYNGVAFLSKANQDPPSHVMRGFEGDPIPEQSRIIRATFAGVDVINAYVVNGKAVGDPKFAMKMEWLSALDQWVRTTADPDQPLLITGDFNITPDDRDVWDADHWKDKVFCTEEERAFLTGLGDWGLQDLQRKFSEEEGLFTWWDYRGGSHPRNLGLRIDLLLASASLADRCTAFQVDGEERRKSTGEGAPSDHAPVFADFSTSS